jgi:SAM-dependent methyltransferase
VGSVTDTPRLYTDLAHLWPLVSDPASYEIEAGLWREMLEKKLGSGRHSILDLGVGGGHHLSHLTESFDATGVDLSEQMLEVSRQLNPDVDHHLGDMRDVRLDKLFSAVLIHDAINYLLTEDDIQRTFETAVAHLEPGGVLAIAPDRLKETFSPPVVSHATTSTPALEVTFVEYAHDPEPNDTTMESVFHYYIKERGKLRVETDQHTMGLFSLETWTTHMGEAGFQVETLPHEIYEDGRESCLIVGQLA